VEIVVNRRAVKIMRGERTGLEIKEAAIEQHVPIQLDFVLTLHKAGGGTKVIGDHDRVRVHNEQRYTAVADDDKS
jgi:Multiubiquitin